jgi:predicted  nucleic acid-binding Zn-ribbon protein
MNNELKEQLNAVRADIRALELQLKAIEAQKAQRIFMTACQRMRARKAYRDAIKIRKHRIAALRARIDLLEEQMNAA